MNNDLVEAQIKAKGALLTAIAKQAAATNSAGVTLKLAEAYAYVSEPDNAHGSTASD